MLELLPTELAIAVIVEAAEYFAATDRKSAVSLALTARYVYHIVRPILLRRVFISDSNCKKINDLLLTPGVGPLVLDLNIAAIMWLPTPEVISCLTNLYCVHGVAMQLAKTISPLSQSARESLCELHIWSDGIMISRVPSRVTRVCVYLEQLGDPPLADLIMWLRAVPLITHIAAELVDAGDHAFYIPPEDLVQGLEQVLEIGGPHLQAIAIRICGDPTDDDQWEPLLDTLKSWSRSSAMAAIRVDRRITLWRDRRRLSGVEEEMRAAIDDSMTGVDIWSNGRVLAEW